MGAHEMDDSEAPQTVDAVLARDSNQQRPSSIRKLNYGRRSGLFLDRDWALLPTNSPIQRVFPTLKFLRSRIRRQLAMQGNLSSAKRETSRLR